VNCRVWELSDQWIFLVFLACSGHAPPAPWENWLYWSDFRSLEARGAAEDLQAVDPAVLLMTVVRDSPSAPSAVTPTPAPEAVVSVSMEPVKNPLCISGADSSTEGDHRLFPSLPSRLIPLPQIKIKPMRQLLLLVRQREIYLSFYPTHFFFSSIKT